MSNLAVVDHGSSITRQPFNKDSRQAAIVEAVERRNLLVEFTSMVMINGADYGKVPGTDKPTLLKPGAEKLNSLYGYHNRLEVVEKAEDWTGEQHGNEPFFYYWYRVVLLDREEKVVATGDGSCNSWEGKYRYRNGERKCPECGAPAIKKSKFPDKKTGKMNWYCYEKVGGCNATFDIDDPAITEQQLGKVPNPDIFSQVNTIQKMAYKRALVAATLLATNASEFFTQDMEDMKLIDVEYTPVIQHQEAVEVPTNRIVYASKDDTKKVIDRAKANGFNESGLMNFLANYGIFKRSEIPAEKVQMLLGKLDEAGQAQHANDRAKDIQDAEYTPVAANDFPSLD